MFQINGLHKYAEQDTWENGCIMEGANAARITVLFVGATAQDVIEKARKFVDVEPDAIERDACEEIGRIDFARTENDDGNELTDTERELWKAGKLRAWYCVYTGYLYEVKPVSAVTA